MSDFSQTDVSLMRQALDLAKQGEGHVEPNPMVGCVIAKNDSVIGSGYHQRYGEAHAEVNALADAGDGAVDATAYVTLEPCCHQGKTGPCTEALIDAKIARVVVAQQDPFPDVDGGGIVRLRNAGIDVDVGLLQREAQQLNAPYRKRLVQKRPWMIAKWAMTLDGKIASKCGHSQWISGSGSRKIVHQLRGRMDAIMVGRQTAVADDPMLNARPPGRRTAARIVVDSKGTLSAESQLVKTARSAPHGAVWIAVTAAECLAADERKEQLARCTTLQQQGCEILSCVGGDRTQRLDDLLRQLARRGLTNVLVEGGGALLGSLLDLNQVDEAHVFIAPKIVGGKQAITPIGGDGYATMDLARKLTAPAIRQIDNDVYIHGRFDSEPG